MLPEETFLRDFQSNIQLVEPVVTKYFADKFHLESIAINFSPYLNQPLVCSYDKKNTYHKSVLELLELFVRRWKQEILFEKEIMLLKDEIILIFKPFIENAEKEEFKSFIIDQRQCIIECLFNKTEIDQKQKAGEFCKGLVNGFEIDMLEKFDEYVIYLLHKPFVTALPMKLVQFTKGVFQKNQSLKDQSVFQDSVSKIIDYINKHFLHIQLTLGNDAYDCEIKNIIAKALEERKSISICIENLIFNEALVLELKSKICCMKLKASKQDFKNTSISFSYDTLELIDLGAETDYQKVISRFPKTLKEFCLSFKYDQFNKKSIAGLAKAINSLSRDIGLTLDFRDCIFDDEVVNELASLLQQIENKKSLLIHDFSYESCKAADKDIEVIGEILKNAKNLSILKLNCKNASITKDGMKFIAQILKNQPDLNVIELNFSNEIATKSNIHASEESTM